MARETPHEVQLERVSKVARIRGCAARGCAISPGKSEVHAVLFWRIVKNCMTVALDAVGYDTV